MITCQTSGGLGNQLFQIATTLALGWENDDRACFNFGNHKQFTQGNIPAIYLDSFYKKLEIINDLPVFIDYHENDFSFNPIPYKQNLRLNGYFQSEKYFKKYRKQLLNVFLNETVLNEFAPYFNLFSYSKCAIHVRRGDYLRYYLGHPPCSKEYYFEAIKLFPDNTRFFVFSDDINWCKQKFVDDRFSFVNTGRDDLDLHLMSRCDHQIISNSTYSWWGAWFNQNPNKIVIAPSNWFGTHKRLNTKDLYTDKMILL